MSFISNIFLFDLLEDLFDRLRGDRHDETPPPPQSTITDTVLDISGAEGFDDNGADFDILREALLATDLVGVLDDPEAEFTVFAPTDAAFIELARTFGAELEDGDEAGALDAILATVTDLAGGEEEGLALLSDILLYHVSPGAQTIAELEAEGLVSTAQGGEITVDGDTLIDADPDVENPQFVDGATDIATSNGVIQAIDRVLLPIDVPEAVAQPSIVEIAADNPDFSLLVRALETAGLVETIDAASGITVFAPTNDAFVQLAVDLGFEGDTSDEDAVFDAIVAALTDLSEDGDPVPLLTDILLYHVAPELLEADEVAGEVSTLLEGASFTAEDGTLTDNDPNAEDPTLAGVTVEGSNGNIVPIDRVLRPIDVPPLEPTIADIAAESGDFDILVAALEATGLDLVVADRDADLTVFAPTDAAFIQLAEDLGIPTDGLDETGVANAIVAALQDLAGGEEEGLQLLTDILLYHVVDGSQSLEEIQAEGTIETELEGASFEVDGKTLIDNDPDVKDPKFVTELTDIEAANGTIQVIDRVLLPVDVPDAVPEGVTLVGGRSSDALEGTAGDDLIIGKGGKDTLQGGDGDDTLEGNRGRDDLYGGTGDDVLKGGSGRDHLEGGAGDDDLWGGSGRDRFDFIAFDGHDVIHDFGRGDRIVVSETEFESFQAILDASVQDGQDTVISGDGGDVRLKDVDLDHLNAHDFFFF